MVNSTDGVPADNEVGSRSPTPIGDISDIEERIRRRQTELVGFQRMTENLVREMNKRWYEIWDEITEKVESGEKALEEAEVAFEKAKSDLKRAQEHLDLCRADKLAARELHPGTIDHIRTEGNKHFTEGRAEIDALEVSIGEARQQAEARQVSPAGEDA